MEYSVIRSNENNKTHAIRSDAITRVPRAVSAAHKRFPTAPAAPMMSVAGEDDDDDDEAQRAEPLRTARRAACRSIKKFEIKLKVRRIILEYDHCKGLKK